MNANTGAKPPRGARDLADLWRSLPLAWVNYPLSALGHGQGLSGIIDTLRARAWREHCAMLKESGRSCVEQGRECALIDSGACLADVLFPERLGGGAGSWRMASLFLHASPASGQLRLLALGRDASVALEWAAALARKEFGLRGDATPRATKLADLELPLASRWQLRFVTPWIVAKQWRKPLARPDLESVTIELGKALRARAHKVTALCIEDPVAQRLGAHLAHHVADYLLPSLTVEKADIEPISLALSSGANRSRFNALAWAGTASICADESLRTWLTLLSLCGGGENPDKGFGGVEVVPVDGQS